MNIFLLIQLRKLCLTDLIHDCRSNPEKISSFRDIESIKDKDIDLEIEVLDETPVVIYDIPVNLVIRSALYSTITFQSIPSSLTLEKIKTSLPSTYSMQSDFKKLTLKLVDFVDTPQISCDILITDLYSIRFLSKIHANQLIIDESIDNVSIFNADIIVKNLLEVNLQKCSIAWGFGANYISACINNTMNITFFQFIDTQVTLNMEKTSVSFQTYTYSSFALIAKNIYVNVKNSSVLFYNYQTKLNAVYDFEQCYISMNISSFEDAVNSHDSHIKILSDSEIFKFEKLNIYLNNSISGLYTRKVYFNNVAFYFSFGLYSTNISHFEAKSLESVSASSENNIGNWNVNYFMCQSSILKFSTLILREIVNIEVYYGQQQFISCQDLQILAPNFAIKYIFVKSNIAMEELIHKKQYIVKAVTMDAKIPLDTIQLIPVAEYDNTTIIDNTDQKFSTLHIKQSLSNSEIYYTQNYNLGWAVSYYCYGFCSPSDEYTTLLTDDTINIWRDRISEVTKIVKIQIIASLQQCPVFDVSDLKYRNFTLSIYCNQMEFCAVKLICNKPKIPLKIEVENLILQLTDFGDESSFSLLNGSLNDYVNATLCKEITTNLEYVNQFLTTSKTNIIIPMTNKNYTFSFCDDMIYIEDILQFSSQKIDQMKNKKLTFHFLNDVIVDVKYIGLDNIPLIYFDCDNGLLTKTFSSVNDFQGQSLIEIIKCKNYENTALYSNKIPYHFYSTPKIHLMEIGQSDTGISINSNLLVHSNQLITFLKSHLILRETVLSEDIDSGFSSPSINEKLILENPTFNCSFKFRCIKIKGDCYLINNASISLYMFEFINSTIYVNTSANCSLYYGTEIEAGKGPKQILLMNEKGGFYLGSVEGVQRYGNTKIQSGKKGYKIDKNLTSNGYYYFYLVKNSHRELYILFGVISFVLVSSAVIVVLSLYSYKKKITLKRIEAQNTVLFGDVLKSAI